MGTAIATVVTVLVNGNQVIRTVFPPKDGQEGEEPARYEMDVHSEDSRTEICAGGDDVLWIYGSVSCNKPEVNTQGITNAISFEVSGPNAAWLKLEPPQFRDGAKCVAVRALRPYPEAELEPGQTTVTVTAVIEGTLFPGPVHLTIEDLDLLIEEIDVPPEPPLA